MLAQEIPICSNCGVIAPTEAKTCDSCKEDLGEAENRRTVPVAAEGRMWIQVHAQFKCRHCEKESPLNHVDMDGTFTCLCCHRDQKVGAGVWPKGLRFCHEVVDLAGPDPEGSHPNPEISIARNNKWSDIGVKRAVGHMRYSETVLGSDGRRFRSLFLQARPGHPLCEECKRVIEVVVKERGHLSARCDPCGWSRNYRAHGKSAHHAKGFLGALADDQRADQQSAKMTAAQHGAPVAIVCPSCAAPLSLEAKDRFVTCEFCHTSAKIPSNLRSQVFAEDVAPEPFWLLFKGPSAARKKIVKQLVARKNKAAKQAKKEANRRQAEKENKLRALRKRKKAEADQRLKRVASVVVAIVVCIIYFLVSRMRR